MIWCGWYLHLPSKRLEELYNNNKKLRNRKANNKNNEYPAVGFDLFPSVPLFRAFLAYVLLVLEGNHISVTTEADDTGAEE